MTAPKTGNVTSNQIAGVTKGSPSAQMNLNSVGSRRVSGRSSGNISFTDFRGRSWVQGNIADIPTNKDPRPEGYYSPGSYISGSGDDWDLYLLQNNFGNGEYKGAMDCNSFFYCSSPDVLHTFTGTVSIYPGNSTIYRDRYGAVFIFGYSAGYLSGSRVTLAQYKQLSANQDKFSMPFTPSASYPYVVINAVAWGDGINSGVQGQENEITVKVTGASITT